MSCFLVPLTLSVNWQGDEYARYSQCWLSSHLVGRGGGTLLSLGSSALICHRRLSQACSCFSSFFLLRVLLAPVPAHLCRALFD